MSRGAGRFTRADRLRSARDFRRIGRGGRRVRTRAFTLLIARSDASDALSGLTRGPRLGITVARHVGTAVVRNRIKRGVREWFRRRRRGLADGIDLVVVARPVAATLSVSKIGEILDAAAFARPRAEG